MFITFSWVVMPKSRQSSKKRKSGKKSSSSRSSRKRKSSTRIKQRLETEIDGQVYRVEDFYMSKKVKHALYRLMAITHNALVTFGIPYFAESGTLIGVMRNKGIIPYDDDIDLSVPEEYISTIRSKTFKEHMAKHNVHVWERKGDGTMIKFFFNTGELQSGYKFRFPWIDIFSVSYRKKRGKRVIQYTHEWARNAWPTIYYYPEEVFPLKLRKFGGIEIYTPNKAATTLDRAYPGWDKIGRLYQSHYLNIELDDDNMIIITGKKLKEVDTNVRSHRQVFPKDKDYVKEW